ncbi:MAG: hypothetical protein WCG59_09635 [Actinomycetes bacterium]
MIFKKAVPLATLFFALGTSLFALSGDAGATTMTRTWTVQGVINFGQVSTIFPTGSTFTATYDSSTGALTNGSLSVPEYIGTFGSSGTVTVNLSDQGDGTGTLAANGAATINDSLTASLLVSNLGATCDVGPMAITASTADQGGSDFGGTPLVGTLVDPQFTAPSVTPSNQCNSLNAFILSLVLSLPSQGDITMTLTQTSDDTPTTTTTSSVTPTTAPAVPSTSIDRADATQRSQLAATGSASGELFVGAVFVVVAGCAFAWRGRACRGSCNRE